MKKTLWLALLLLAGCAGGPLPDQDEVLEFDEDLPLNPVVHLDLDRYLGRWYIIANIPYFAESGNVGVYVEYTMRKDGIIADRYTAQDRFDLPPFTKDGLIEVTNPINNAEGRISFLPPIWQEYAVLSIDADYRHTVIGHPSRNYCWIFARERRMSDAAYQEALETLKANGFDVSRVFKIPQLPEDIGQPGFQ